MRNSRLLTYYLIILSILILSMAFVACETGSTSGGGGGSEVLFSDHFDGSDDTWLDNWYYQGGVDFTSNYAIYHETGANGTAYCMNLFGGYGDLDVYAYEEVSSSGIHPTSVSFYMKSDSTSKECGLIRLYSSGGYASLMCYFGSTYIYIYTSSAVQVQTYAANIWYHIEFRNINWTAHTYDFYINGSLKNTGAGFVNASSSDAMYLEIMNYTEDSDFYIDEIVMN